MKNQAQWLPATPHKLPRWRGFNLLAKFHRDWRNGPFLESDFRLISELGFNFVRLPMDYRTWIRNNDWDQFDEAVLKEIDQAVAWGGKYGIHVCINFHRAPGYSVARPKEKRSLWTDPEAQRVCAKHWAMFARRYRGIPNERLSFNLMNEPAHVKPDVYIAVARKLVAAIRKQDPDRLIISDGLDWGKTPVLELASLNIAQATRGYIPMGITHYKASWVGSGAMNLPPPTWPRKIAYGTLYSPEKKEYAVPFVLRGPFPCNVDLRLHVGVVSKAAHLVVKADGNTLYEKKFVCGPGKGEWKTAEFKPKWKIYQNLYDRDYTTRVPAGTRELRISVASGDWLRLTEIGLRPTGTETAREDVLPLLGDWGKKPEPVTYAPGRTDGPFLTPHSEGRQWLWDTCIAPWKKLEARGVGVMVGEWGAYNKTPHPVVLAWMKDCLDNWKKAGWGWALWNFRGSFGILDSDRTDVQYEDYQGHKLDRAMLELLQQY